MVLSNFPTSKCPKVKLNKVSIPKNQTFAGLTDMLQGFQRYFFRNPRSQGIESKVQSTYDLSAGTILPH